MAKQKEKCRKKEDLKTKKNIVNNKKNTINKGINPKISFIWLIVAIFFVFIITIGLISNRNNTNENNGIDYDEIPNNGDIYENGQSETQENVKIELKDWMNYILKQNLNKVAYIPGLEEESKDVSIDVLKKFFNEFSRHNYSISQVYSLNRKVEANYVKISYIKNNKEYKLVIENATWLYFDGETDKSFISELEKENIEISGKEYQNNNFTKLEYKFTDLNKDANSKVSPFVYYFDIFE